MKTYEIGYVVWFSDGLTKRFKHKVEAYNITIALGIYLRDVRKMIEEKPGVTSVEEKFIIEVKDDGHKRDL